jgi:1-aminocyclopropane-1-carboxylate deaminase/D-cysteine desulfhydrase-like pyridoxal-dependent ACC family enzyme
LVHAQRLSQAWGGPEIWIKRDDLTGFGLSGNKVRKLEFHVAAAQQAGATTLVTCGAVQSNHCRATAIVAAQVGLRCILLLRSTNGEPPQRIEGNHLLQRLAGAEVRFISYDEWEERERLMADVATEVSENGGLAWVMPAGASDQLGVAAFEHAAGELAEQLEANQVRGPITVWHASSSGGTTAGLAIGVARQGLDARVVGASVGKFGDELGGKVTTVLSIEERALKLIARIQQDGRVLSTGAGVRNGCDHPRNSAKTLASRVVFVIARRVEPANRLEAIMKVVGM